MTREERVATMKQRVKEYVDAQLKKGKQGLYGQMTLSYTFEGLAHEIVALEERVEQLEERRPQYVPPTRYR